MCASYIQWITSCHKNRMATSAHTRNVIENDHVIMRFLIETVHFEAEKNHIPKGHIINRILHSWSFHMKSMILAKASFHKFHSK